MKRGNVGERGPPESNLLRGKSSEFLNLDQTDDAVCPDLSVARRDPSPYDTALSTYHDCELQGTIQLPPLQNDDYRGAISE